MDLYSTLIKQRSVANESFNLNLSALCLNGWFFILLLMMVSVLFFMCFEINHQRNFEQALTYRTTSRFNVIRSESEEGLIDKTVKSKAFEIEKSPSSRQPQNPMPKAEFQPSSSKLEDPNTEIKYTTSPLNPKKAGPVLHPIILQASSRYQVDPNLVKAIIMAESSYNPKAISKKGAMGLMQLMPKTAEALGVEDGFNPEHNIDGGVRYFRQLLNQFNGDVKLALAAYNAGSRKVKEYQGIPPFTTTKYYIKKVFEYYQHYKRQTQKENGEA